MKKTFKGKYRCGHEGQVCVEKVHAAHRDLKVSAEKTFAEQICPDCRRGVVHDIVEKYECL